MTFLFSYFPSLLYFSLKHTWHWPRIQDENVTMCTNIYICVIYIYIYICNSKFIYKQIAVLQNLLNVH